MSIVLNKNIYDESQGNPFKSIMDWLDDLDSKTKTTMAKIEKSIMDVGKTGGGSELKELTEQTQKLQTETDRLIKIEQAKLNIKKQLETDEAKYIALQDNTVRQLINQKTENQALIRQYSEQAKLASQNISATQKYRIELKNLKGVLLEAGKGTKEYNDALKRAAFLTDELGDMQARVKGTAMDFEGVMGNAVKVTTGIAGAFEAAQGAAALFGVENEDLQKTMLKVQAAIAITNGLQGLDGMGKAFKNLLVQIRTFAQGVNKALSATIIGAFLAAIVAVIAYWDDIKEAITGVGKEQKKLLEDSQKMAEAERDKLTAIEESENILKLQGKTERQILEDKIKAAGIAIEAAKDEFEMQQLIALKQVENSKRNQAIILQMLEPLRMALTMIDDTIARLGKLIGKKWDLGLRDMTKEVASWVFDPEKVEKEGGEAVKAAEKKLKDIQSKWAGYHLDVKELDRKASEDYEKELEKRTEAENKSLLEKLAAEKEKREFIAAQEAELFASEKQMQDETVAAKEDADAAEIANALEKYEALSEIRDKQQEEEKARLQEIADLYTKAAGAAGEQIAQLAVEGELTFKQFSKIILKTALDAIQAQLMIGRVGILLKELGTKGFAGIASAAFLMALIQAAFAVAKGAVAKFAKGKDYVDGPGTGTSDSIPARLSKGERVVPAEINKQMLGIKNKDLPTVINAGLNSLRVEGYLQEVTRYTSETANYLANAETGWENKDFTIVKNWKTGKTILHPKK